MDDKIEKIEEIDTKTKMTDTARVARHDKYLYVPIRKYVRTGLKIQQGDLVEVTFRHTGINSRPNPNLFKRMDKQMEQIIERKEEEQEMK